MAANASSLLLCWDFITSSQGPQPNKIADAEVNNKCSKELRLPDISRLFYKSRLLFRPPA
jgi:hypothetical protein